MNALAPTPEGILRFWFDYAGPAKWYASSPAFDARIRRLFAASVEQEAAAMKAGRHAWMDTPEGCLALIILFDQLPRNIWRGSGRAFAYDGLAVDIAHRMIERGFDWAIADDRRAFIYLPFMHSECLDDQDYCVELCRSRLTGGGNIEHAIKHREVIEKFGRFPYRNDALQRISTPEECDYLDSGGYAPGRKDSAKSS